MTKVYVLCLDAFPEIPRLKEYLTKQGLTRSTLVCAGAFTISTMSSLFSGSLGSEIIPKINGTSTVNPTTGLVQNRKKFTGGIGYKTAYYEQFFEWRKSKQSLIDRLDLCIIHNHVPWFSNVLCNYQLTTKEKTQHYRDRKAPMDMSNTNVYDFGVIKSCYKNCNTTKFSSTNPDMTLNTFCKWNSPPDMKKFYANESKYIKFIQKLKFNGLFFSDLCHFHEYAYYTCHDPNLKDKITATDAINNSLKWLKNWNWSEPNSVFYVFADHSHRVRPYLDPPGYLTWVYFKDNRTTTPKIKLSPFVSTIDFYPMVEKIFGLKPIPRSKWAGFGRYHKGRVFACEDNRANGTNLLEATTFLRGIIYKTKWLSLAYITASKAMKPGYYVTISNLTLKHTYSVYYFKTKLTDPPTNYFMIECPDDLTPLKKTKVILPGFELTPDIMAQIKKLLTVLD